MKKLIILLALLSLAVSCGKDKATSSDKSVKSVTLSRNLMMLGTGIDFPQAVDLGLDKIMWWDMNIGATTVTGVGKPFHWASIVSTDLEALTPYIMYLRDENDNYYQMVTKYCQTAKYGYEGYTDGWSVLEAKDDATKYIYLPITGNPNYALGAYTYEISHVNSDVNYDIHTGSTSVRTGSLYIRAVMTK